MIKNRKQKTKIKIIHQNIQGTNRKIPLIENFVAEEKPQILCLTEHWQLNDNLEHMKINGYNLAAHFSRKDKIHGGTAIYTCQKINKTSITKIPNKPKSLEIHFEWSGIKIKEPTDIIQIITIYRSPNGNMKTFF